MSFAFLVVSVVCVLAVLNAYHPVRREPVTAVSFFAGWFVGELAVQNIVVEAAAVALFVRFGALRAWPGDLALALAVAGCLGLIGLAVSGARAASVVTEALRDATGPPLGVSAPPPAAWARWWRLLRAVPVRTSGAEIVRNLDYWGDGIRRHRLDVLRPRGVTSGAPVMIYIHGGAWIIGDKREQGRPMLYELVARGWVCVALNYRLSPRATWPDHIVDCKRAIAWVRAHIAEYGGDPSFIALSGGSAGGHLSALAALTAGDSTWQPGFETADTSVDACLPSYGVMDMTGDPSAGGKYGPGLLGLLERRVMKATFADRPDLFEEASPTRRVHAGAPPFFVMHGRNDTLVPVEVARQFVDALRAVSAAPVAYAELPLAQHAFDVLASPRSRATSAGTVAFLDAVRATGAGGQVRDDAQSPARPPLPG